MRRRRSRSSQGASFLTHASACSKFATCWRAHASVVLIHSDMARTDAFVASILDVVQLSQDLKLALEGQIEPDSPSSVNHEQAALNTQLIQDCEHMAREIDILEAELEDQKSRTESRPESHPGTARSEDTNVMLRELQNLEEDNRSGVCVCVQLVMCEGGLGDGERDTIVRMPLIHMRVRVRA